MLIYWNKPEVIPVMSMGPGGGPVIDLDALMVGNASQFFGRRVGKINKSLVTIEKAKAFPDNIELAFTVPDGSGRLVTLAYSVSALPEKTGYKPRTADARIGYFTTTHLDLAKPGEDDPYVRYINRWNLEKADPNPMVDPPSSTGIWIDTRALERWLGAQPAEDGAPALVIDGETYERVTVDLVCRAGMLAASYLLDTCPPGRCVRRPGAERMGCGVCCGRAGGCMAREE